MIGVEGAEMESGVEGVGGGIGMKGEREGEQQEKIAGMEGEGGLE